VDRTGSNRICLFRKFSQVISPRNVGGFGYEDRKKHILIRDAPESAGRKREGAKGGLP
jgi:hypothetical protein